MAAKLLHSLTDDNIELQKQIGCMNGIFQLFDRHHVLTGGGGRRVVVAQSHNKGLQKGVSDFNGDALEGESNDEHLGSASTEKIPVKTFQRISLSSLSRSSSSSSLDCIRTTPLEPASFDRITFPETPSRDPSMSLQNSSPQFSRQNRDIRDMVKDSMYRDSPRLHSEIINGSGLDTKQRAHDDLKESPTVVAKVQEPPPRNHNARRHLVRSLSYNSKDESPSLSSRDAPRFSYDGREGNRAPFDPRLKLKDLPRLSLDGSKAGSMRSLKSTQPDSGELDGKAQNLPQSSGHQARPPSVVAKLMGLETLPHSVAPVKTNTSVSKSYLDTEFVNNLRPSAERDRSSVTPTSSSKNSWKEPTSPRWRNPVEPAPWKLTEGRKTSQKPGSRTTRGAAKAESASSSSVYSEIEKRLNDLEFTQSGKDLRALKHILEAMQSKKMLQTQKEVINSNFEEQQSRSKHEARSVVERRKPQTEEGLASTKRAIIAARHNESPIVIMKPARDLSSKSGQRDSAVTLVNMKNDRTLKATQASTRSQQSARDGYAGAGKSSVSVSPRLLQKKLELEKRARPPTPPDSSKFRRQPNKQLGESNSPGGRRRPKHPNEKPSDVNNVESRNVNYHDNENMVQSNTSVATFETSPSAGEASEPVLSVSIEQMPTLSLNKDKSAEFGIIPVEYSSPVSVLDNRVHKDDSPSPVTYKVDMSMEKEESDVFRGSCADIDIPNSTEYGFKSELNQNKFQNIENLVQKLRRLNSSHDEAGTDYIASLCENTDPEHRYISEILLASGLLLRDLGSSLMDFQYHPSGHPINPELFLVLEQTKASTPEKKTEMMIKGKLRRKLVFDTVNEILARKLASAGPLRRLKVTRTTAMNAQKLLREVCSEIEGGKAKCSTGGEDEGWKGVVWKDVMYHQSEWWRDFDDEMSGAVLDIERSIFKDLVNEIVIGESAASGLKIKPVGRIRPLVK